MSRYRIDFVVRELDVPADQARGISFGEDLEVGKIYDFMTRCRDAVSALLGLNGPKKGMEINVEIPRQPVQVQPAAPPYVHTPQQTYKADKLRDSVEKELIKLFERSTTKGRYNPTDHD